MKGIMPFVRVPINIAKYTLERSPAGAGKIAWDLALDRPGMQAKGAGDLADRMSRATLGSMVMGGLYKYAEGGNLTGRAPKDPNERAQWEREGKTPYSFRTPFGWQSYEALQPFAALIATAADAQDAVQRGDRDDKDFGAIGTAAAFALARGLVNTQFTQGLTDTLDLLQDKGASSENIGLAVTRQAGQMASNLVPMAGGLRAVARMTDDVIRDPKDEGWEGITDRMQMGIPGRQENVPEAVGAFGETRHRVSSGLSAGINPSPLSQPIDDPVEAELKRLQEQQSKSLPKKLGNYTVEPGFVGKDITIGDRVALPVELNEDQRRWYQRESGRLSYAILSGKVGTAEWEAMSDLEKAAEVEDIYNDSRKVARKMLEKPEVGLVDQAMEGLMQGLRQRKARTQSQAPAQTTGG